MRTFISTLATGFLMSLQVLAQLPAPTQSLDLAPHETLAGTLRLANHNTVLLIASSEESDVRVVALTPDGKQAWTAKLDKLQKSQPQRRLFQSTEDMMSKVNRLSFLLPMRIYSTGNEIYALEVVSGDALERAGKEFVKKTGLKPDELLIQHIDEQGKVANSAIMPPDYPNRLERHFINQFGEGGAFYRFYEEVDNRADTRTHILERYDLATSRSSRITLPLGATPERRSMNIFYNRWTYLGHRPNQTYFVRRLASHGKEAPLSTPMEFEVLVTDNAGKRVSGFTTHLNLQEGTFAAYSGTLPVLVGEHFPYETYQAGRVIYDSFRATTGGIGDFYLDYETGDVLIFGDYRDKKMDRTNMWNGRLRGFFLERYDVAGNRKQQAQIPYPADIYLKYEAFTGAMERLCNFTCDPITGNYEYSFFCYQNKTTRYTLVVDQQMQQKRFTAKPWTRPKNNELPPTPLQIAGPLCAVKPRGMDFEVRFPEQYGDQEAPLYAQQAQAREQQIKTHPMLAYFLSGTGNGHALLLEHAEQLGGKVNVYVF